MVGTRGPLEASIRPDSRALCRTLRGSQELGSQAVRQRLVRELTAAHGARRVRPRGEVPRGAPDGDSAEAVTGGVTKELQVETSRVPWEGFVRPSPPAITFNC